MKQDCDPSIEVRRIIDELIELLEPRDNGLWFSKLKYERKNLESRGEGVNADGMLDWFGGMGSLNDFMVQLDPSFGQADFQQTNKRIDELRSELWYKLRTVSSKFPYPDPLTVYRGNEALHHLERLRHVADNRDEWSGEYIDPITGTEWILDHPNSEQHGGGIPRLMTKARKTV